MKQGGVTAITTDIQTGAASSVSTDQDVNVKVSVCMITYNHAPFIAQAIESVLAQRTCFPIELVIGEDCSTDDTRRIILEYQRQYPGLIRLLLNDKNLGGHDNFINTYSACRGEYIALLEGDDYWTDPFKLQMQVDFLDTHLDCVACFHNVEVRYENEKDHQAHPFHLMPLQARLSLADIVSDFHIPTLSTLFRSGLVTEFPQWYRSMPMGDWPLHILLAHYGDFAYFDMVMGVYRRHAGGVWSSMQRRDNLLRCVKAIETVRRNIERRYRPYLNALKATLLLEATEISLAQRNLINGMIDGGRSYLALQNSSHRRPFSLKRLWKVVRRGVGKTIRMRPDIGGRSNS